MRIIIVGTRLLLLPGTIYYLIENYKYVFQA